MISMSRWDGEFSSASWSLAKTFAKNGPVYYVDYPFTWLDLWRERHMDRIKKRKNALFFSKDFVNSIPGEDPNLKSITPPAMFPINWLSPGAIYENLLRRNNSKLQDCIKKALRQDGHKSCILLNSFNPIYLQELSADFPAEFFVYQSRDNIRALEPYLQKHGSYLEIRCIQNADFSIATSLQLTKDLTAISGKEVQYFPNAADIALFETAYNSILQIPKDILDIPHPIIGYTGNICHRLDYEIIQRVATEHPEKSIVLVGPRNHYGHTDIDLDAIPNLYFTGPKSIKDLPAYLQHFDVLILPFLCNELTKSIYPLKINEYLASGKPVVSTPFSEDILLFKDVVYLADSSSEFSQNISVALQENTPGKAEARNKVAASNSWDARVARFWDLISKFSKQKS
ncbi:MAG: glycosyltransferase [Saprospiraceae bacterium]|nr:glycosyltransferase [Saprospiraceae bacterium]